MDGHILIPICMPLSLYFSIGGEIMTEFNLFPKFLDEAATPVAQSVGNTISSIWSIVFGGIDNYAAKTNIKRAHHLNQFKSLLDEQVSAVPEEKLVEPPLHIIGPTLEASKYYFESAELRTMFAKLIAASINIDTISKAHPAFVEIIKQLSPLDAKNLLLFKEKSRHPIVEYFFIIKDGHGNTPYKTDVFLENEENQDIELNSTSLSNLSRLGLVFREYRIHLTNEDYYKKYYDYLEYRALVTLFDTKQNESLPYYNQFQGIDLTKGVATLSPLGSSFIEICL